MQHATMWTTSIWLIVCCFGLVIGEERDIHMMHLSRESFYSFKFQHMTDFISEMINNDTNLLPGYRLHIENGFTQVSNDIGHTVKEFNRLVSNAPTKLMVVGPMFTPEAKVIGEVAPLYNLAQVCYYVTTPDMSDTTKYPYFARTQESTALRNPAIIRVLQHYNWTKVAIITETLDYVISAANDLKTLLKKENITLLSTVTFDESPTQAVSEIKASEARIIIIYTGHVAARYVMCEVYRQDMYAGPRQLLFWDQNGHFALAEEKFEGTGCTMAQVHLACEYMIVVWAEEPSEEDEKTLMGDSGYTITGLRAKYATYLTDHGHDQSKLSTPAFDGFWVAAKALTASIPQLEVNETLDQFAYSNERLMPMVFNNVKKLQFVGSSGPISFDDKGDRESIVIISQHTADGGIKDVGRYDPLDLSLTWSTNVSFPYGDPPLDTEIPASIILKLDSALFWTLTILAIVGMVYSVACIVFNVYFSHLSLIKQSSPMINALIAVGCGLCLLFIPMQGIDNDEEVGSNSLCSVRIIIIVVGFALAYGGVFAKTWKIHVKFSNKTWPVRDHHLMTFAGLILVINVILLIIWQTSDTLEVDLLTIREEILEDGELVNHQAYICSADNMNEWIVGMCWFNGLLLAVGLLFAWETRKVQIEEMNDSQEIGICIFVITILSVTCVPIYRLIPNDEMNWAFGVTSIFVLVCAITTLLLVFGPKMHLVATGGHRIDDRTVFFSSKNGAKKESSTTAVVSAGNAEDGM